MLFTELALNPELQKGIAHAKYITCTPVQEQVLSCLQSGTDLYVQSQTGTGKTAAFLITVIQNLLQNQSNTKTALVLAPTRELAAQIEEEAKILTKFTKLHTACFYGGVGYTHQQAQLKKGVNILIGTPGRIIDLQESGQMDLSKVGFLVIDEADRMFDMGFYPDLRTLIKVLPNSKNRQTMLFSATLNTYVKNLAWEYTENAAEITIEAEQVAVNEISQQLIHVASNEKMRLLLGILHKEQCESCIVFCNTKKMTEIVAKRLQLNGFETEFIIGDLPQSKRLQVMNAFKSGKLKCLTATDVAARGIDVNDLQLVVNYDLPNEAENYIHRIGRTARAGKTGKAFSFCSEQDVYNLPAIEKYMQISIPSIVASDDMLAADKSSHAYIKTGRYDDEERKFAKENPKQQKDFRKNEKQFSKKPVRLPQKATQKTPHKKEREKTNYDLSNLSFDERMKIYKQKYSGQNTNTDLKKDLNKKPETKSPKFGFLKTIKKILGLSIE